MKIPIKLSPIGSHVDIARLISTFLNEVVPFVDVCYADLEYSSWHNVQSMWACDRKEVLIGWQCTRNCRWEVMFPFAAEYSINWSTATIFDVNVPLLSFDGYVFPRICTASYQATGAVYPSWYLEEARCGSIISFTELSKRHLNCSEYHTASWKSNWRWWCTQIVKNDKGFGKSE